MKQVCIAGAGPAGASAAIAAALGGACVTMYDKSRFPKHKVCGEFLSPEILGPLEKLGVMGRVEAHGPARIERLRLRFPRYEKTARLPDPALGLSRHALDQLLRDRATELGVEIKREGADLEPRPLILAIGREARETVPGRRLFGFKTHYTGPSSDAIELYFFDNGYVGVSSIEGGQTNVCGVAAEAALSAQGFDFDQVVNGFTPLRERLAPMQRSMPWLSCGPLIFGNRFHDEVRDGIYPVGDALSFIDPFTGTGLAGALLTGELAGECAAGGVNSREYMLRCRGILHQPFAAASVFRAALTTQWAEVAAALIPAAWLVKLTRPKKKDR